MEISIEKQQEYIRRILTARMAILSKNGFFGLLLMHMKFALDENIGTAAADGERIYFAPSFLDDLSEDELIFILMHEIMHVALRHVFRVGARDRDLFNIACDIVVNSNILFAAGMNKKSITLTGYGEAMHIAPNGAEGYRHSADEVYEMLFANGYRSMVQDSSYESADDHSKWGENITEDLAEEWASRVREAYEAASSGGTGKGRGVIPCGVERELKELLEPKTDWRTLLNDFVQEEIVDYSFTPPDRRFSDSPFFLPDFNEVETTVKNVLFMIDTSASMSEEEITEAYSEIKGAIDQFGGRLEGWLGFFDTHVIPPAPFTDEYEFSIIRPRGGGSTSFDVIFKYIRNEMADKEITSLIIMTDGYAPFPGKSASMGIPVLWIITNDKVTPPWGKVVRL